MLLLSDGRAEEQAGPVAEGVPFVTTFLTLHEDDWYRSSYRHPGEFFRVAWSPDQVGHIPGQVTLTLEPSPEGVDRDFVSGELQREGFFGYGRYEVLMTPAKVHGVVSAFFVYSGPHFGTTHEEIDFEFLGRDTTQVWINHFVDGEAQTKRLVPLGFDASEGKNLYAFDWSPEEIVWYVNGEEIFRTSAEGLPVARPPAKIYISMIAGNRFMEQWSGIAADDAEGSARYYCLSYRPPEDDGLSCSDLFPVTAQNDAQDGTQ